MERIKLFLRKELVPQIFGEDVLAGLRNFGELEIWEEEDEGDFLRNATIVITSWGSPMLKEEVLEIAPGLRFIFHSAGTIKPYVQRRLMERGVRVSCASNVLGRYVAMTNLGYILLSAKKIFWWNEHIKTRGGWRDNERLWNFTEEVNYLNIGIISMSWVGRHTLSYLKRFTDRIFVYDPYWQADEIEGYGGRKVEDLLTLAQKCEIICLCAPLTEETKGMIGRDFFKAMKDGSVFINTARGGIIQWDAFVEELEKGRIFAVLDVTDPYEPLPTDSKLRKLKNVVISPHIAGCVRGGLKDIGRFCLEEVGRFLRGEELVNEVKLERLDITA
ncbi:MAG: hydroxyacid dehydrogenase [bacterium]